jgi:glucose/arabinose dehydrogenase
VIRVDPETGMALPDNPLVVSSDPNARRVIAFGFRSPFRFTFRPGTNEIWVADVGAGHWEEIELVADPADDVVENFGWPCYEGPDRGPSEWAGLALCRNLYADPSAVTPPVHAYTHDDHVVPGERCRTGSSAIAGVAFARGGEYPDEYDGALFFADYIRDCIWVMPADAAGEPDPARQEVFVMFAANPVDLEIGPDGDLYYLDHDGGTLRRIRIAGS